MRELRFEWDERKNLANRRKHGIPFDEAASVFFDDHAVELYDEEHAEWEDRFLLLGLSARLRLLLVCYCSREEGDAIRIISARRATKTEQEFYTWGGA